MVGLLDLRACGQSNVTSTERRGVFGDLRLSCFLQGRGEESQCEWCGVSSFAPPPLFFRAGVLVCWSSAFFLMSRNLSFISFFSSDRIRLGFLCFLLRSLRIGRKITFNHFYFWQISPTFRYALILCAETPFYHFEESLRTDNIRWMLSWALVAIIILCVR